MSQGRNFVVSLAKANQSVQEIKDTINLSFVDQALSKSQLCWLIAVVKASKDKKNNRGEKATNHIQAAKVMKAVKAFVESDHQICVKVIK